MTEREGGPTTLASVAASAGVSIATVSKVLNGRGDVGPETRARVQTLLEEQDYVGRRADPSGRPPLGATVELVLHGSLSGYFLEVLEGVSEAAIESGVSIGISIRPRPQGANGKANSTAWVRQLNQLGRLAVIDVVDDIRHGDLTALTRSRLPLVVLDPLNMPRKQVASVGTTNFSGGFAATQHLIAFGHHRIAFMGAVAGAAYNQARLHGYRAALEGAGIDVPPEYVRNGDFDYRSGLAGGAILLDLPVPPTAIFVATDEAAAGVIEAARIRKLRIPEDVSIVGFDDTEIARLLSPPLTTVRQPLREMGRVAMRTALRLAAGETLDSHHVELATELIVRSSTGAPSHP